LLKIFVIFFSFIEEDENDGRDLERDEDPEVVRLGNVVPRQSKENNHSTATQFRTQNYVLVQL
jgi:hypothetical protein